MNSSFDRRNNDRGGTGSSAMTWIAAFLAVTTVVAGLGWAGIIGGDDAAAPATTTTTTAVSTTTTTLPTPTEWTATAAGEILLHGCPAGAVVGHVLPGDPVTVIGRAPGNAWVAVKDPADAAITVWLVAAELTPDPAAPAWADLPQLPCDLGGEPVQSFSGQVVDATNGVPLAGVSVSPTDPAGAPLTAYTVVTAADGSYELAGLVDSSYGIWVDGAAVGYEQGFTGAAVSPLGFVVLPTWEEAAPAAPGTIGDIALDSNGAPATTVVDGSLVPTTLPAGPNVPPVIGTLTADPGTIYSKPSTPGLCKTTSATLSVDVTDASGVVSVTVAWSYRSFSGTVTLARVGSSDTWQGTIGDLPDPTNPVAVALVVTATDTEGLVAALPFGQSLGLKKCG